MSDENQELIEEFLTESEDLLVTLNDNLIEIEGAVGEKLETVINVCFRSIHTIKGAAGFLNFTNIADLTHVMEDLLSLARANELVLDVNHINLLLEGTKKLEEFLPMHFESNNEDISDLVERIRKSKDVWNENDDEKVYSFPFDEELLNVESNDFIFMVIVDTKGEKESHAIVERELSKIGSLQASIMGVDCYSYCLVETVLEESFVMNALDGLFIVACITLADCKKLELADADFFVIEHERDQVNEDSNESVDEEDHSTPENLEVQKNETEKQGSEEITKIKEPVTAQQNKHVNIEGTIKIKVGLLQGLMDMMGELVLSRNQFKNRVSAELAPTFEIMAQQVTQLQETVMKLRLQPVSTLYSKAPRMVRELSQQLNKKVKLEMLGKNVELDRKMIEALSNPLTHIIRNSMDHGLESTEDRIKAGKPESGEIVLKTYNQGGNVVIDIIDDGRGIDPQKVAESAVKKGLLTEEEAFALSEHEQKELVFLPGFSTADQVSEVSGRGVGMDVVRSNIMEINGKIDLLGDMGTGTTVRLTLPLTLAVVPALIAVAGEATVAIPRINIAELVLIDGQEGSKIERVSGRPVYQLRDSLLSVIRLTQILGIDSLYEDVESGQINIERRELGERRTQLKIKDDELRESEDTTRRKARTTEFLIVLKYGKSNFGLLVDKLLTPEEIVVKPLPVYLGNVPHYSGASIMGNGTVIPIFNPQVLQEYVDRESLDAHVHKQISSEYKSFLHNFVIIRVYDQYLAIPQEMVLRIDEADPQNYQHIDDEVFLCIEESSIPIIITTRIDNKSDEVFNEKGIAVVPKFLKMDVGIFAHEIIDILETDVKIDKNPNENSIYLGSGLINKRMVRIIDVFALIKQVFPNKELLLSSNPKLSKNKNRILVAEDSPVFQKIIMGALKEGGFETELANDGLEAMELFNSSAPFDIVLTDIDMPNMDGFGVLAEIKKTGPDHTPVIALTARNEDQDIEKGIKAGFLDYLVKFDKENMLSTVSRRIKEKVNA